MKKTNIGKEDIIWKDKKTQEIFRSFLFFSPAIIIFTLILVARNSFEKNLSYVLFIISLWGVYIQVRRRFNYVTSKGIRIGNLVYKSDDKIFLRQKPKFFLWNEIKILNIITKDYFGPRGGKTYQHLMLKNKQGEVYDCILFE